MKKLLLVDSDNDCSFALRKQLEFDKIYLVHQVTGSQELQELKEEKKITILPEQKHINLVACVK